MDDLSVIDRFTETFSRYIDSGFGLVAGDVAFLTSGLVAIDITLAGLFWALVGEDNIPAQLIRKVLYIGFFALLLNNFKGLADIVFQSFAGLGLKASGASLTAADLMRPGFVASTGFSASRPLLEKAGELMGVTSFFSNFVTIVVLLLAWLIVLLAFFVLSVQLFITIIEFKLTVLAGFVLVPFALFGHTAFLAERVLGNVVSAGIKMMVLAVVVGIGASLFGTLVRASGDITLNAAAATILAAIAVFGLAVFVPALAAGLVSGAPQLGAGSAVATSAALGGSAVAGGILAASGTRLAGRIGGGSLNAAAALTGRVGAAHEAGGARGVARTLITAPAGRLARSGAAPLSDAHARTARPRATGMPRLQIPARTMAEAGPNQAQVRPPPPRRGGRALWRAGSARRRQASWPRRRCARATVPQAAVRPISRTRTRTRVKEMAVSFKRAGLRYGETPEPVTPYQKAAQVWDQRIGASRVQAHNWRLMALGSLLLALMLSALLLWIGRSASTIPYIVEVDPRGGARAVGPATEIYKPTDAQIAFHLSRFVDNVRSLSIDPVVVRQNWLKAYDFVSERAAVTLNEYARDADPFSRVGRESIAVEVTSVLRASESSYQVRWVERSFEGGALKDTKWLTGLFSIVITPPKTVELLRKNPLGIFIHGFSWSQDVNRGEPK